MRVRSPWAWRTAHRMRFPHSFDRLYATIMRALRVHLAPSRTLLQAPAIGPIYGWAGQPVPASRLF